MPDAIDRTRAWLRANGHGEVAHCHAVGSGPGGHCVRIDLFDGTQLLLKRNHTAPPDLFTREAEGLRALADSGCVRTPRVLHHDHSALLMEYIAQRSPDAAFWERLGAALARMHARPAPCYGFSHDNYCGPTPQPNPREPDGHRFFAERRLLYQARLAADAGRLPDADLKGVESICRRLPELVPVMPPVLLHGDLWSGNVLCATGSEPVLIDPAAHWGWAEAEIAMTRLFGGFDAAFMDAYLSHHPLQAGWEQRLPLYNLYHLLNHLNLFGDAYAGQVREVIRRFA